MSEPSKLKTRQISGLSEIAGRAGPYDSLFCDVWGVLHNGVRPFAGTVDALSRFRSETGGSVVLVTNAPRPAAAIATQLSGLGVPETAYDGIVTSGDVTRAAVAASPGARVFHLGPDRDLGFYDGLDVTLVGAEEADLISCTGLFDDTAETPDDYRERFETYLSRDLPMICANPDIVVERGDRLIWCGGALARLYRELGGEVVLAGKPHAPIYDAAMDAAGLSDRSRVLAIGDGLPTDVRGACNAGIDVLFITGGIHSSDFGPLMTPDPDKVRARLQAEGLSAVAFMPMLAWTGSPAGGAP